MPEIKEKKAGERGVVVKNPMPYDPSNIKLSKADFVAKQKAQREKDLKVKEFAKTLDEPKKEVKAEAPKVTKPKGRPKKIE